MIKIKVVNHLNKIVILEVDESVLNEITKILLDKHITEDIVNAAVNNLFKKP